MHCNFSAKMTAGKHLIINAFLDLHWVFHPILASIPGRQTVNNGRSLAFAEWPPHRSLFIMAGNTQKNLQHEVPKEPDLPLPRINLTFWHIQHK